MPKKIIDKLDIDSRRSRFLRNLKFQGKVLKYDSQFIKLHLEKSRRKSNCIKLYFNIKPDKDSIANYFCDLIDFDN